jgi:hypothetical protein
VHRGGGFTDPDASLAFDARGRHAPEAREAWLGFRLVWTPEER